MAPIRIGFEPQQSQNLVSKCNGFSETGWFLLIVAPNFRDFNSYDWIIIVLILKISLSLFAFNSHSFIHSFLHSFNHVYLGTVAPPVHENCSSGGRGKKTSTKFQRFVQR